MKKNSIIFSLIVTFLVCSDMQLLGQVPWTRDARNPIMSGGASGEWNHHIFWPNVLYNSDSARYEMWYSGSDGPANGWRPMYIGFATSPDGINWTQIDTAVLKPTIGSWDESSVESPMVIRENGQYKMWYDGWSPTNPVDALGYATSEDGKNWVKHPNPVMTRSGANWDAGGVGACYVMPFSGGYKMWYSGWTADYNNGDIGYATSTDGITWVPYNNNPVVKHSAAGGWDDGSVESPYVQIINDTYHLWYTGIKPGAAFPFQIGWATSVDGINWHKYDDPNTTSVSYAQSDPVLKPGSNGRWDGSGVQTGTVLVEGDSLLRLWYCGALSPVSGNPWKIGVATAPVILNVPGDYSAIQAAIDAAVDGNVVLVADSTYQENINFKGKSITVASHYYIDGDTSHISNTVVDGSNPSNPDSGSVVTFNSGEDTTSVLMGFTITGGTGTITQYIWDGPHPVRAGGGVFCYDAGARIARNKIIKNNIPHYVESTGAGIAALLWNNSDNVIIDSNQIINNTLNGTNSWGGAVWLNNNGAIINNEISYNTSNADDKAWGAVASGSDAAHPRNVTIKDNIINHNQAKGQRSYAGGVSIEGGTSTLITGNLISHNEVIGTIEGKGGGIEIALEDISNISITNNIISGNSAAIGGGISIQNSKSEIVNNTIVNNSANTGGGIWTDNSKPVVVNSIVWGNQASSGPGISGTPQIVYSDIQGGFTGEGNLNVDPLFVPGDSLFHLMVTPDTSSCLNTGVDSVQILGHMYYAPDHDYAGNSRPQPDGTRPDMGAWESVVVNSLEFLDGLQIPLTFELKQNYPNPFNPITTIEYQLPKASLVDLSIYNLLGQKVAILVFQKQPAGSYRVEWNAGDFASGVYLYRLQTDAGFVQSRKLVVLK